MTPTPLALSDRNTRILITLFLATMLAAIGVAELNIYDKVGRLRNGVVERYGPSTSSEEAASSADIASLPRENELLVARLNTFSQLLDVTHAHVFELPLVLFVLAHFLMRSRVAEWFKLANYLGSSLGAILFLAAPWTVRYISVYTASLLYVGAIAVGVTATLMIVVPIWDMWR
jgi:hypothetical protein